MRVSNESLSFIETKVEAISDSVPKLEACEKFVQHISNQILTLSARIDSVDNNTGRGRV